MIPPHGSKKAVAQKAAAFFHAFCPFLPALFLEEPEFCVFYAGFFPVFMR
jgi:hypothetical protein